MNIKLLTEQHLEFLNVNGGCTGLSESTLVKIPHCWKSYVAAHLYNIARDSTACIYKWSEIQFLQNTEIGSHFKIVN